MGNKLVITRSQMSDFMDWYEDHRGSISYGNAFLKFFESNSEISNLDSKIKSQLNQVDNHSVTELLVELIEIDESN